MAKRFIDTEMFCDEWFSELSKDAKLFFIYFITTCDHAGVLKLNKKLCEFQTGLKNIDTVVKELGNSLVTVKENIFFMPKFIKFQYPNFPNSAVKQQDSALKLLKQYGFWDDKTNTYITVSEQLPNYYDSDNVNDIVDVVNIGFNVFWNLYNKKVGDKNRCEVKWNKLKDTDRQKIIDTLPNFISNIKDKQYQPHPETYLNQERWNDEIQIETTVKKMVM